MRQLLPQLALLLRQGVVLRLALGHGELHLELDLLAPQVLELLPHVLELRLRWTCFG